MGTGVGAISSIAKQDQARKKKMAEIRSSQEWREKLSHARKLISYGRTLAEVRDDLDIKKDWDWECFSAIMAQAFANPANVMLEWQIRNQSRYMASQNLLKLAIEEPDPDVKFQKMSKAIMLAAQLDQNVLELQKALGLIKPVSFNDEGEGISSEDIEIAQRRFNQLIEQRIQDKLVSERETQSAQSVTLFPRLESGRETDPVEPPPLATNNTNG